MTRPRLLDLFCGAGGAAAGYVRAGFDVTGVDIRPQPRYLLSGTSEFHQADALTFPLDGFDAIHASPPCQAYSIATATHAKANHEQLVAPMLERLARRSVPWVLENVPGAPVPNPLVLCGASFGLTTLDHLSGEPLVLRRHRLFGSSHLLFGMPCECAAYRLAGFTVGGVYGRGSGTLERARSVRRGGYTPPVAVQRELMGIDWMPGEALDQAIPPAYTSWIGAQLVRVIRAIEAERVA